MPDVFTLISPRGGIGQSTLSADLACRFALDGMRVLLVDLSPTSPALDILCGVAEHKIYTLTDAVEDAARTFLSPMIGKGKKQKAWENLLILPLSPREPLSTERAVQGLRAAISASCADVVLLDAEEDMLDAARAVSDGIYLLTKGDVLSLRTAEAFVTAYPFCHGWIWMQAPLSREEILCMTPLYDMTEMLGLPLMGIIPKRPSFLSELAGMHGTYYEKGVQNLASRLKGTRTTLLEGIPLEGIAKKDFFERTANGL